MSEGRGVEQQWQEGSEKKRHRESESNQLTFQVRDHRKEKKGRGDDLDCCQRKRKSRGREEKRGTRV